jgi:hypothetical protein
MKAVHIRTHGMESTIDAQLAEGVLGMLAGVAGVMASSSLSIVSVLYDEHKLSPDTLVRALRATGFDATLVSVDPAFAA